MIRAYYDDAYSREFTARITERLLHDGHPAVLLNTTYFYPTSGGQPNDTGVINGVRVIDVVARKDDGAVIHVLAGEIDADAVRCEIDWARRFDHMQHHTGQHILSQAFVQLADANTVGFHLSPDSVTIDLDRLNLPDDQIDAVETLANAVVMGDHPVTARIVDPDAADGVRMRKLPEHLLTGGLRVIDIDGFDVTACGGTHVARTGEIGIIKILRLEKRGDKTRVEFRCGGRALRDYRLKNAIANRLTADFTCALEELPSSAARLADDFKAAQRALKTASGLLLDYEAASLVTAAPEVGGVRVIKAAFADRDFADVRGLATRVAAGQGCVALLAAVGDKTQLAFARSADLSHDMNGLLRHILPLLGDGRGGGQPQMAQGGGSADAIQVGMALDEAERAVRAGAY